MERPQIQGYEILAEIGAGSAGVVYEAKREDGSLCAIKVFDSISSNTTLLGNRVGRVIEGGALDVTVPVMAQDLDSRPGCVVMPLMADRREGEEEQFRPRTLQNFWGDYQANELTWPFILKLATRLATLHAAKVAHGNLKPGNIFLGANGGPLLSDYASGLMPGVHRLEYSDALLYAPPEQLRYPEGYEEEAGYRWDVYAFGVLAYRLLTGVFPRCEENFKFVSPASGPQQRFEIEVDYEGIAKGLNESFAFRWSTEPADELEAKRREMLKFCLALDPMGRPGNMREVSRYFESIEIDLAAEEENQKLIALRKKADRMRRAATRKFSLASLVALGLGGGWAFTQALRSSESKKAVKEFARFQDKSDSTISDLKSQRDLAAAGEELAVREKAEIQTALLQEQSKAAGELVSAQETNERLFDWLLEEGVDGLPALEGRQDRLKIIAGKVDEQLSGMEGRPTLQKQAATLRLRRAELALAMGEIEDGAAKLAEAIQSGGLSDPLTARAQLRLLLLKSKNDPGQVEPMVVGFEKILPNAWPDDESRTLRAKGALELVKARLWEARNDGAKALASYQASLNHYKDLAQKYPETPAVCILVGRRYLSAATAAEGEGSFENAAKLRADAAAAFISLAEKQERPSPELQYQIASATAARAISMWQQGDTFGAEKLAREGVARLTSLQTKLPHDFQVTVDLASQQGIIATALRDEGNPKEARILLNKGIKALEAGIIKMPKAWGARYLLASLKWQLSGLMGQEGESESELKMGEAAREELKILLTSGMFRPHPSEVRKSLAYLCGDLGHSADLKNNRELAVKYLKESRRYWQELARDKGDQLEIREGYHWAATRLAEMGVK